MADNLYQQVEDGSYFIAARHWYIDKYIMLRTHLAAMTLLTLIGCLGAYWIGDSMLAKYKVLKYPFITYADDQVLLQSRIKSLSIGSEPINISVARYLISDYVMNREGYKSTNITTTAIQEKVAGIQAKSSRKVYMQYMQNLDIRLNPNSPLLRYKLQVDRDIEILSITFPMNSYRPNTADVVLRATERSSAGDSVSYWNIKINFSLNNVTNVLDYDATLNFIVMDYEAQLKPDNNERDE